jgi:hypothetical protein
MLNKKLKEKFEIFDKIDKISSNENTKQSLFKNKDSYLLNEANNNSVNQAFHFIYMGNYLKNLNKNNNLNESFNNKFQNNKVENLKEKFPDKSRKIFISKENSKEKNPEKFVFQFFYNEPHTSNNNKTENVKYHNISKHIKLKSNKLRPKTGKTYRQNECYYEERHNHSFSNINNQLLNYKIMLTRANNNTNNERNNKSKENNKINKLIKKLYNDGIQDIRKKEILYKENLMKKSEEYKKYPFSPNDTKNKKSKKNKGIKIDKLNEKFYSKQVEWKNKKIKENSQKKKFEEENYLSQFSFKPNIKQEYIADDQKLIKRNLNDMNNYILKRRNQIRYKKEEGFKLRDYKPNNINIDNNIEYKEPLTERIYYRNGNELNNTHIITTVKQINYSKYDFLRAVKKLHNEIRNLNI